MEHGSDAAPRYRIGLVIPKAPLSERALSSAPGSPARAVLVLRVMGWRALVGDEESAPPKARILHAVIRFSPRPCFGAKKAMAKTYFVYIMSNKSRRLYTGITSELQARVF